MDRTRSVRDGGGSRQPRNNHDLTARRRPALPTAPLRLHKIPHGENPGFESEPPSNPSKTQPQKLSTADGFNTSEPVRYCTYRLRMEGSRSLFTARGRCVSSVELAPRPGRAGPAHAERRSWWVQRRVIGSRLSPSGPTSSGPKRGGSHLRGPGPNIPSPHAGGDPRQRCETPPCPRPPTITTRGDAGCCVSSIYR